MQFLDDGVVRGHTLHPKRQHHGQNGGQTFRHGGHGKRDGQQQGVDHILRGVEAREHGKCHQHHDGDDAHRDAENLGDVIHLLLQRGFLVLRGGEHAGDLADLRVHAGTGHNRAARALSHGRAVEDHVGTVAQRLRLGKRVRLLADRHGFAGQRGLRDAQTGRIDQSAIGGNRIALGENDDVAGNHVSGIDAHDPAATQHRSLRGGHLRKRLDGRLGLGLLHVAEHGIDDKNQHDHDGVERKRLAAFRAGLRL